MSGSRVRRFDATATIVRNDIQRRTPTAPVNDIIDREGKIAAARLGGDQKRTQGIDVLTKLELYGID